jgi:hypothetical protein
MADTLVLRSGKQIEGTYLGGDSRKVRMAVGDGIQSFDVNEISEIKFGASEHPTAAAPARDEAPRQRVELMRPSPEPAVAARSANAQEIPAGTALVIRMIDDVDSERDQVGQTFRASLDEAVALDGNVVVPRGADAVVKLVADKQSGRLTGKTELTLDIVSLTVDGRTLEVATQEITQESASRTTQTAQRAGGVAALGAVIGAIAGGGKGAAIGAVSGAAAGGAVQVSTTGQRVRSPSETRLTFTLQQPVRL